MALDSYPTLWKVIWQASICIYYLPIVYTILEEYFNLPTKRIHSNRSKLLTIRHFKLKKWRLRPLISVIAVWWWSVIWDGTYYFWFQPLECWATGVSVTLWGHQLKRPLPRRLVMGSAIIFALFAWRREWPICPARADTPHCFICDCFWKMAISHSVLGPQERKRLPRWQNQ